MNMDVQNKLEYQFLDFANLSTEEIQNVLDILNPNTNTNALKLPGETEHNLDSNSTGHELQNHWSQNAIVQADPVEGYIKCDSPANEIYVPSIPQAYPYGPVMPICSEWAPPVYLSNVTPDVSQYISGMHYGHPTYNMGAEMHDVTPPRENNGRRFNKGRAMKRDTYRVNQVNEIPPAYMGEQAMHPPVQMMYQMFINQIDHPVPPQQPVTYYYQPPMPPQTAPHMPSHQSYHHHHHPSPSLRNVRHSPQILSQSTQEFTKTRKVIPQNTYTPAKPPYQPPEDDSSNPSHINIDTTVIVNNSNSKLDPCVENVEENTANRKTVTNNNKVSPVNVKIEHNIVSTVNENCTGTEKSDVPRVNINSSIEVKQNGETDKEFQNETVSSIKTTVVKTLSKPTSKTSESDTQNENCMTNKNVTDQEIAAKVPNTLQAMSTAPQVAAPVNKSWASVVKTENIDSTPISSKPMARITPLPPNSVGDKSKNLTSIAQKDHPINATPVSSCDNRAPDMSITDNEYNKTFMEPTQIQCDDPTIFRMGEFLLNYQMDKQTVSLLPRGLTNRSNYCYINSILQALLACPPFYNLLMAMPCPKNPSKNSSVPLISNMVKFVQEFTPLSDAARLPRKDRAHKRGEDNVVDIQYGVAFEPSYVYTMLQNTSAAGGFSVEGKQEDAEEFLSCLLNGINDEMLELMKLVNNTDQNITTEMEQPVSSGHGEEEWKVMGPKNKGSITRCTEVGRTPLSDIFRGQLRTKVSRTGEQTTDNIQPFFTLQLDIEKAESVREALDILVGKDPLEGMTCSKTNQQIEAWKTVSLEELPVILILHLKWFDYKLDGCSKILKSVKFPVDLRLDDNKESKIITQNIVKKMTPKQKQYKLFAVTYHDGKEATKGHYITDAWHVGYGNWVRYDDSTLKGVSESSVLNPNLPRVPYLLYYRRCDTIGSQNSKSR